MHADVYDPQGGLAPGGSVVLVLSEAKRTVLVLANVFFVNHREHRGTQRTQQS